MLASSRALLFADGKSASAVSMPPSRDARDACFGRFCKRHSGETSWGERPTHNASTSCIGYLPISAILEADAILAISPWDILERQGGHHCQVGTLVLLREKHACYLGRRGDFITGSSGFHSVPLYTHAYPNR